MMLYSEQVQHLSATDNGFIHVLEALKSLKKIKSPRVLNFSHNDLDGIGSAVIMRRLLQQYTNAEIVTKLPPHFKLTVQELQRALESDSFDMLLLTDKGTFDYYDDFLGMVKQVVIIDHHPNDGMPKRCVLFNPSAEQSVPSAASLLCHMVSSKLELADECDDFAALLGCRGDFAFDPVQKTSVDFVKPFVTRMQEEFPNMFEPRLDRATIFDIVDRERTALINQIAEVLHVGCLAHMYARVHENIDVDYGPGFVFEILSAFLSKRVKVEKFRSLSDFMGSLPDGEKLVSVFEYYKRDWDLLSRRAENASVLLGAINGVGIYILFAREATAMHGAPFPALLPYVASARLEPLKRESGYPHTMVIVFCPKDRGVHISMRGGGGLVGCGAMCSELANRLQKRYPEQGGIGGGGHDRAAECVVDRPVPMYAVMHELLMLIEEMAKKSKGTSSSL
jgi:hypothetical protein